MLNEHHIVTRRNKRNNGVGDVKVFNFFGKQVGIIGYTQLKIVIIQNFEGHTLKGNNETI